MLRPSILLLTLLLLLPAAATAQVEGGSAEERKLFHDVMQRLLQTPQVRAGMPAQLAWPPAKMFIQPNSDSDRTDCAYAEIRGKSKSGKLRVEIGISEHCMRKIVKGNADILAAIMGHELGRLRKRHPSNPELTGLALSREQVREADLEGMKIAAAAGYPEKSSMRALQQQLAVLGDFAHFKALKDERPPWASRLEWLDKDRTHIWKAMAAFDNGYFFLDAEQYRTAENCFDTVTANFPECGEAWANLGHARLMQYCDDMTVKELRDKGIGQFVTGCFYSRPEGLVSRGGEEQWKKAIADLNRALSLDKDLMLVRANLALAYLVHPDGKQADRAVAYFREALDRKKDKGLDSGSLAAFYINFAVAELAAGHVKEARDLLGQARKLMSRGDALQAAILYNEALIAAGSEDKEERAQGFVKLRNYLGQTGPASLWWQLAQERYAKLGQELGRKVEAKQDLARAYMATLPRVIPSVESAGAKLITLTDATTDVLRLLGQQKNVGIPIHANSKIRRYYEAAPGVDLLADRNVLAIFLTSAKAPPVFVRGTGLGAVKKPLRVGMSQRDFDDVMQGLPRPDKQKRCVDDPSCAKYICYLELGLAISFSAGHVQELVIAQIPQQIGP